jgi:23S rRNA (cytidine1920-2'-O)/16S rRNA (cytidine1409-2'-O)-methyltransferase
MSRNRLDRELVRRHRFPTRSAARNAINAGYVAVDGIVVTKPALGVGAETEIEVSDEARDYVGRGAYKLAAALAEFDVNVEERRAIDVGASTGGFTQVLLEAGAASVLALDVGRDQLHPRLRADPRVEVWEGTNVRDVGVAELGGPFDVVTVDLSFISVRAVAPDLEQLGGSDADWIVLVKPQFEVGRDNLSKDGVVRNPGMRGRAIVEVVGSFARIGLVTTGAMKSPIEGGSGNVEAMIRLQRRGAAIVSADAFKVLADE